MFGELANVRGHSVEDKRARALLRARGKAVVIWVRAHLRNWDIRELRQDDAVDSDQAAHCNTPLTIHRGHHPDWASVPYLAVSQTLTASSFSRCLPVILLRVGKRESKRYVRVLLAPDFDRGLDEIVQRIALLRRIQFQVPPNRQLHAVRIMCSA